MRKVLIAVGITLLVSGVLLGLVGVFGGSQLATPVVEFVRVSWSEDPMPAWMRTGPRFQTRYDMVIFPKRISRLKRILGGFEERWEVLSSSVSGPRSGRRGRITLRLGFEKGDCEATFELVEIKRTWLVDDMQWRPPTKLLRKSPEEMLLKFGRKFLESWSRGNQFGSPEHMFTEALAGRRTVEDIKDERDQLVRDLGAFQKLEMRTNRETGPDARSLEYDIEYESGVVSGALDVVWNGFNWELDDLRFEVR